MLNVAAEISQLVHSIHAMDDLGVKLASVEGSILAQRTTAQASNALYSVITKCACDFVPGEMTNHLRMVSFVDKVASVLGRPDLPNDLKLKLASAVTADDALSSVLGVEQDAEECAKLAEAQAFGREFVMEILQGVL